MDFESDLRAEILKYLPHNQTDESSLSHMRINDLLITFLNWLHRCVHPHPREVLRSREITSNPLWTNKQTDLDAIVSKLKAGADISAHLSKGILRGHAPKKTNTKNLLNRKDLDLLLNEWGIHHLHLSNVIEPDGFVTRGDLLLFVIFSQTRAYMLDIIRHGYWTEQRLVEIAVNNWPEDKLFVELKGIMPEPAISAKDRNNFRRVGVATSVNVSGKAYVSRTGGLTLSGTSSKMTIEAVRLHRRIKEFEDRCRNNPDDLRRYFQKAHGQWPPEPEFHLELVRSQVGFPFAIREQKSGGLLPL